MKKTIIFLVLIAILNSCSNNKSEPIRSETNQKEEKDYKALGKKIAMTTGGVMKRKLMTAMKSGGVEKAVNFCNLNASAITDSLSNFYHVEIKRTSSKLRNQENKASLEELDILDFYQEVFNKNLKPTPVLRNKNFYAPIKISGACLACHGNIEKSENYQIIKKLYPKDKAINYKEGDFRGMWHITFK